MTTAPPRRNAIVLAPPARQPYDLAMANRDDYLAGDDAALLADCDVQTFKASGPGGQHRNKVSSAVRLRHRPTGIDATAVESRSQHQNKAAALKRLRMHLACRLRLPPPPPPAKPPPVVAECLFRPRGRDSSTPLRIEVGRKDGRFWPVAAFLLDLLEHSQGRLAEAADRLGISTSNLAGVLRSERHLLGATQQIRQKYSQKPLR